MLASTEKQPDIMSEKLSNKWSRIRKHLIFLLIALVLVPVKLSPADASADTGGTLVVGVAEWRNEGGPELQINQQAYNLLSSELDRLGVENVTLVMIPAMLDSAQDVDHIAAIYEVDVILWGWYDEIGTRSYVDLANATQENGLTNSLDAFLKHGGSPQAIRVLKILSNFDYYETGLYFCVPRWQP